ncbi:ABC transporter family substrate-binding protein [Bailinhaonella thermotolerans]|uniref:ABC transporter family substrate-binding protein n=1 Tax=Bailinhaonella thermotolerans TaxID=1070861 RepID=A0A3A4AWV3_9ACTN|nr:ABC transporter family substrate-binding protein [Bailinhaonella thermotolerans]
MLAATGLSACGNQKESGQSPTSAPRGGAKAKAFDINPQPRDKVKDGGVLRWAINEFPTQWNANHVDGNLANALLVINALMPSLFRSDEKGKVTPNPDYLTDAKITATKPKQVVTYTLNPKSKWSDGKPITWRDLAAQWKALNGKNGAYQPADTTGYRDIESVERGKDDRQAVVTFSRPFGEWQSLFYITPLYPASANETPEQFNKGYVGKIPVTAGPFKFQSFDKTAKTTTLVRDPAWWGDKPKLDSIVFRSMESDAQVGAFTNGEVDLFDVGPSAADYQRARGAQGAVVRQAAGPDYRHFHLNGESPTLSDVNVRRALAMAINRQAIAQSDLQGLNWPITLLDNHFFMNTQEGYQANGAQPAKYDAAQAGRLLDQAGWRMQGNQRVKNGKPLTVRFVVPSGVQLTRSEAEIAMSMLQQIGVKLSIETVPSDDYFTKYIIPGNYDMTAFAYIGNPFPASGARGNYANAVTGASGRQWGANLSRVGSPQVDAAMDRAISELDPAKARTLTNEADKLLWNEMGVLTLYQRPQNYAVKNTLANVGARGFYSLRYADIGFTR